MTPVLVTLSAVLAQQQPPPNAPEFGGSSPVGLVVIAALFIAMAFLIRSMNTHLRKVPSSFDKPDQGQGGGTEGDAPADEGRDAATITDTGTGTGAEGPDRQPG